MAVKPTATKSLYGETPSATAGLNEMLKRYQKMDMMWEDLTDESYFLGELKKRGKTFSQAGGGPWDIPFIGGRASSVKYGGLTGSADIAEHQAVKGSEPRYPELWGSMIFNERDLIEHNGSGLSEKSFMRMFPEVQEDFQKYMFSKVSHHLLNGPVIDTTTAITASTLTVSRPERFTLKQKLVVSDTTPAATGTLATEVYVQGINMDTNVLTISTARGSAQNAALTVTEGNFDGSAYKIYDDGQINNPGVDASIGSVWTLQNQYNDLVGCLLSNDNGGTASLHGVAKTAYPFMQAVQVQGSGMTTANINEVIFDAVVKVRRIGKGKATHVLMSYENLGHALKKLQDAVRYAEKDRKAQYSNFVEVDALGFRYGNLSYVGVPELNNTEMPIIDWDAFKLISNGWFERRKSLDGTMYFELRNEGTGAASSDNGFQYILDIRFFAQLLCLRPSNCGIIHSIPTTLS